MFSIAFPGRAAALGFGFLLLILMLGGCGLLRRGPVPVDRTQDARILQEVQERLATEPAIDGSLIRVSVDGAIVTLYGTVVGIDGWNCAILNAQLVEGVRAVVDYLAIERGRALPCTARRSTMARNLPPPMIAVWSTNGTGLRVTPGSA